MLATLTTETSPSESRTSSRAPNSPLSTSTKASAGSRFWRILLVLLALETGILLLLIPWSSLWDRNFVLGSLSSLQAYTRSYHLRGAVSALGVVNLWAGFVEAWLLLRTAKRSTSDSGE
jgi:hypothetical protein